MTTVFIIIGIAFAGFILFMGLKLLYDERKRPAPIEPKPDLGDKSPMEVMHSKMVSLDQKDMPYGVRIVQQQHFVSFQEMVNAIPQLPDGGTFLPALESLEMAGPGLYETDYTHQGSTWHLFLLVTENKEPEKPKSRVFNIDIKDDGTDQTAYINAQIREVPNGTPDAPNIIKFPKGRFWTEGDLRNNFRGQNGILNLYGLNHIIISAYGCTLYTTAPAVPFESKIDNNEQSLRRHVWVNRCSYVQVWGLRIEGSNTIEGSKIGTDPELTPSFWKGGPDRGAFGGAPAYHKPWELEHAFATDRSHHIIFKDCEVYGVWGDGIYMGGKDQNPSLQITIIGGNIQYTGRQGIAAANAEHILVDGIETNFGRRAITDWEPYEDEGFVRYVEVKNSRLWGTGTVIAALGKGDVSHINYHHNEYRTMGRLIDCKPSGDWERRSDWKFNNNVSVNEFGSPRENISFASTDQIEILNNIILIDPKQSQLVGAFVDCRGLRISGNDFGFGKYIKTIGCSEMEIDQPELEKLLI